MRKSPEKNTAYNRLRFEPALFSLITAFAGQFYLYHAKNIHAGLALFAVSAALFVVAAVLEKNYGTEEEKPAVLSRKKEIILFALIILTAGVFRFYQLDTLPAGAHRDEAKAALDALYLSQGRQPIQADSKLPVYIKGLTDNPAAYNYIMAVFYKFHPAGAITGRAASALLGVLAVAAMYFLARAMFGVNCAVIAGFMLAFCRWHFTFTRHILHAGFLVFILILALYFCFKAYKEGKIAYFIAAGFCSAFVLYTFQAGKAFFAVLAVCAIYILAVDREFIRKNLKKILYGTAVFIITVTPLAAYFAAHAGDFTFRASDLFIFNQQRAASMEGFSAMAGIYLSSLAKALLMFNKTGSAYLVYNYNFAPMLDFMTGLFFVLGFVYSVYMAVTGSKKHAILLIVFVIALHGTALFIETPHATRGIMTLPVAVLMAAAGAERLWQMLPAAGPGMIKKLAIPAAVIVFIAAAGENYRIYFEDFKKDRLAWDAFSADSRLAGQYLARLGPGWNAIIDPRYAYMYESYAFMLETAGLKGITTEKLDFERHMKNGVLNKGRNVFLINGLLINTADRLKAMFPGGSFEPVYETYNPQQLSFFAYKVDGEAGSRE